MSRRTTSDHERQPHRLRSFSNADLSSA